MSVLLSDILFDDFDLEPLIKVSLVWETNDDNDGTHTGWWIGGSGISAFLDGVTQEDESGARDTADSRLLTAMGMKRATGWKRDLDLSFYCYTI